MPETQRVFAEGLLFPADPSLNLLSFEEGLPKR